MTMCYQLIERHSGCNCLYYQHAPDRCPDYGRYGHHIKIRTIIVGYACPKHSIVYETMPASYDNRPNSSIETENDSDDDLSSTHAFLFDGSDVSSITSASSVESMTALQCLTNGFLSDGYLYDLWPQIFLRAVSVAKAREEIELLILRYSLDLQKSARNRIASQESSSPEIRASQFVKRKRRYLAHEIYKKFGLPLPIECNAVEKAVDDESDNDDNQQPDDDRFLNLQAFLFDSEPFHCFRENVQLFIQNASSDSLHVTWLDSMRIFFNNNYITISRRKWLRGKEKRLQWTCKCGMDIYDDYTEIQIGALDPLEKLLTDYGVQSKNPGDVESRGTNPTPNTSNIRGSLSTYLRSKHTDLRLPRFWRKKSDVKPGECLQIPQKNKDEKHNYLLACLPFGRWVSKLYQPEICTIYLDQDFFSLLRMLYCNDRRILTFSWMRRVQGIHFVQVDVHHTEIASIRSQPALPPENLKDQYLYEPMPAQLNPPIGSNMLVHFFENPTHASVFPDLYKRIPKKLREKLTAGQVAGLSQGWGIQIVEGVDMLKFFLCGCVCFIVCLLVAVAWSVSRKDVQGGFGIGGFLLAFMIFCGGIIHSSITPEYSSSGIKDKR